MEGLDPVHDVLDSADLGGSQGTHLRGGQWQRGDLLGRVAVSEQPGGGVRGDPGEQCRQVREVVVDGCGGHRLPLAVAAGVAGGGQVVAPDGDFARGDGREPVVAEPARHPRDESREVAGDLSGDLRRADSAHGQVEVALAPGGEAVVGRIEALGEPDHLS
ncbi:hypothetical protein [[Actinomadura] parvosata]|uniref:hypothetical protein n=1 Tax=[Actinomadura] parvosata TaxID=1955412 RepID=UPI00164455C1|nr:hypothetical protein [Nonomuraea sp. ATCC 55076]